MNIQSVNLPTYISCDERIHLLCQPLAKINRSLVPHETDDSHTNLAYDSVQHRILGRWFDIKGKSFIAAIDLERYQYLIIDERFHEQGQVDFLGKDSKQIEAELTMILAQLGISSKVLFAPLHFEITDYIFKDEPFQKAHFKGISAWMEARDLANMACEKITTHLQAKGETRIWPHHFDTGVYIEVNKEMGLGFGLAMADSMVSEPYFYFSRYALNESAFDWENTPELDAGSWLIGEYFKGAILPLDAADSMDDFIKQVTTYYLK